MLRTQPLSLLLFPLGFLAATGQAETINVPEDFPTIQEAISASQDLDTVSVSPGTYVENISFLGKAISVESTDGPEVTIIDGSQSGTVVTFDNDESADSILKGFTITNGTASTVANFPRGGGILCHMSSPSLLDNIVTENAAGCGTSFGGGIYCRNSEALIVGNIISNNVANEGGGICLVDSSPHIENNFIIGNGCPDQGVGGGIENISACPVDGCANPSAPIIISNSITENCAMLGGGLAFLSGRSTPIISGNVIHGNSVSSGSIQPPVGGGIYAQFAVLTLTNNLILNNSSDSSGGGVRLCLTDLAIVTNNVFHGNVAEVGGGISLHGVREARITNTVLWSNTATTDPQIELVNSNLSVANSVVQGGWTGVEILDEDPKFVDPTNRDFHLRPDSPAINRGSNNAPALPEHDFEGEPRILDRTVDIGADEFSAGARFLRGDVDTDLEFNGLVDALFLLNYAFVPNSPPFTCAESADVDGDGSLNPLSDALLALGCQFLAAEPCPTAPFPFCGRDPNPATSLGCVEYPACP